MIGRCKHYWDEATRVYTPSVFERMKKLGYSKFKTGDYASQEAHDRALHGFTTVELVCIHCGDTKARYLLGDVPAPVKEPSCR